MKVVLKCDDFCINEYDQDPVKPYWDFVELCKKMDLKVSLGVVGHSLGEYDKMHLTGFVAIRDLNFQPFSHSYYHTKDDSDQDYARNQMTIQNRLNHKPKVLGFPQNNAKVLDFKALGITHVYYLKGWPLLDALSQSVKLIDINGYRKMEIWGEFVDFERFKRDFVEQEQIVYQLHPNAWKPKDLDEFGKCIEFLKQKKVAFAFPIELDK